RGKISSSRNGKIFTRCCIGVAVKKPKPPGHKCEGVSLYHTGGQRESRRSATGARSPKKGQPRNPRGFLAGDTPARAGQSKRGLTYADDVDENPDGGRKSRSGADDGRHGLCAVHRHPGGGKYRIGNRHRPGGYQ